MLIPVILGGGVGARLWPLSRKSYPKPFIRLEDGRSLLQGAFVRAARLPGVSAMMTVTRSEIFFKTQDHYREIEEKGDGGGDLTNHFILEPFGRGTAPSVALASLYCAAEFGEDAVLLILPADHLISRQTAFAEAVAQACDFARASHITTFGIQPRTAESGYGYIECDGNSVKRFVEKPEAQTAQEYLRAGNFLWNSGMFCSTAETMLAEMDSYCPDIVAAAKTSLEQARKSDAAPGVRSEIDAHTFAAMPENSIDRAVMERTAKAAVVACDIGWSDLGSWDALGGRTAPDSHGNRSEGDVILRDSRDCTILAEKRVIGAVGLENLLIVDTPDALLVADRDHTQAAKQVYGALEKRGHEAADYHRTVERHWGSYTVLDGGSGFKVKRIEVRVGGQLSLQTHEHRNEHWTVVAGTATVTNGDDTFTLRPNESTYIERRCRHRLENHATEPLVVIEVQTGDYLGEDDIVRY